MLVQYIYRNYRCFKRAAAADLAEYTCEELENNGNKMLVTDQR